MSSITLFLVCSLFPLSLSGQVPDTVYLLNHWRKSPQAGTLREFLQQWRDPNRIKEDRESPKGFGWDCFIPAWRGIQDSIDLPVFRYHYKPYSYTRGFLRFFVKEEPTQLTSEQLKGIRFFPTRKFMKPFEDYDYDSYRRQFGGKELYIVHVTSKGAKLYHVFGFTDEADVDLLYIGEYPYNPDSYHGRPESRLSPEEKQRQKEALKRLKRYGMGSKWE